MGRTETPTSLSPPLSLSKSHGPTSLLRSCIRRLLPLCLWAPRPTLDVQCRRWMPWTVPLHNPPPPPADGGVWLGLGYMPCTCESRI